MYSDEDIQEKIEQALASNPLLDASIAVTVRQGIVTLAGTLSDDLKEQAESITKNIPGVKAVVQRINADEAGDEAIAVDAVHILESLTGIFEPVIKVERGWVTLEGKTISPEQKATAKQLVEKLAGVLGVVNNIDVSYEHIPICQPVLERALSQCAALDDALIKMKIAGHSVILTGIVRSEYQKEVAGHIIAAAPGVKSVTNLLLVKHD